MKQQILVIEDNVENRYLFTYILEKEGYAVLQAADGRAGLDVARRQRPALILLDMHLPVMDGYTFARKLRKDRTLCETPIIAVTSDAMLEDREQALTAGCTGYLEKPVDPVRLLTEVRRHLPAGT